MTTTKKRPDDHIGKLSRCPDCNSVLISHSFTGQTRCETCHREVTMLERIEYATSGGNVKTRRPR